jgi:hypothetical protein
LQLRFQKDIKRKGNFKLMANNWALTKMSSDGLSVCGTGSESSSQVGQWTLEQESSTEKFSCKESRKTNKELLHF